MPQFCAFKTRCPESSRPRPGLMSIVTTVIGLVLALGVQAADAQSCEPPPDIPVNWVLCGECRGDLNGDGLLNGLDLMLFEVYREQIPQNPCADFNDNGVVDTFDQQILICVVDESDGACVADCGDPLNQSCFVAANPGDPVPGGCADPTCCATVCEVDPQCCTDLWDITCVAIATEICQPNSPDTRVDVGDALRIHEYARPFGSGSGLPNDCLAAHPTPGCADGRCLELVCVADPACCETAWDDACVALAKIHCQSPCTSPRIQEEVCNLRPECCESGLWDEACTQFATFWLLQGNAAAFDVKPRAFLLSPVPEPSPKDPLPFQTAVDRFRGLLCQIDPTYCTPGGDLAFFQDIQIALATIAVNYPDCVDQFLGNEWDAGCAQVAARLTRRPQPGDVGLGPCLRAHGGLGCADAYCSELVCNLDPTCCSIEWDTDCVRLAGRQCELVPSRDLAFGDVGTIGSVSTGIAPLECGAEGVGSCCYKNSTPYCRDAECCQLVCGYDAYCCDVRWDELCATLATAGCETLSEQCGCGPKTIVFGPIGRSCFEPRDPVKAQYPAGCEDAGCCNTVCAVDPFCCEVLWDQVCADGAETLCAQAFPLCGQILAGSCFVPRDNPYCDDESCCESVCLVDPLCCNDAWDEDCVGLAREVCTECGDSYSGSCFAPHPGPACSDEACCEAVCDVDPFCCLENWDGSCVAATAFFPAECDRTLSCGDPSSRNCFVSSPDPGCSDSVCCKNVCEDYDPWCCEVRWDSMCAAQAFTVCDIPFIVNAREPCDQFHLTPACNDPECSAAVCSIPGLEFCCTQRWDTACVDAAATVCVGLYECPGVGDCQKSKATPMCDDAACCNAVCTIDPTCCTVQWDNSCAVLGISLCIVPSSTPSGDDWECPCEGSCFEARPEDDPKPGCDDASCCAAICNVDELCCTVNWDAECVLLADFYCGSGLQCGSFSTGSCLESSETPFCDDSVCCQAVCAIDPSCCINTWDSFCVATAFDRCRRGCGVATAGSCFFPHLSPGCSDGDCCVEVCDDDPLCCTLVWDSTCAEAALIACEPPECGDFPAGDCCLPNGTPSCNDKRCCDDVCSDDPFCCDTTWDDGCVQLARQSTRCDCGANWDCGDPCAGGCCVPNGTPKCDDEDCCEAVCLEDSFCCDVTWDLVCANMARANESCTGPEDACPAPVCGDADAGDCCFPNGTRACSNADCCEDVCDVDAACCDVAWDSICAQLAAEICEDLCDSDLACGSDETLPCNVPHDGPYCSDEACCEQVCLFEPFCCLGDWDEFCVLLADTYCNLP